MPGLRLSLTADRPFTTFKANAFTPELSDSQGWDTEVYPLTSTYTLGFSRAAADGLEFVEPGPVQRFSYWARSKL